MILQTLQHGLPAGVKTKRNPSGRATPETRGTLVLGLGNPILADDGVGLLVAQRVHDMLPSGQETEIRKESVAGFDLLDILSGFQRVIVIDAIRTARGAPGQVYRLTPEDLPTSERLAASHEISLSTALSLGRLMDIEMPGEVVIYAIEVEDNRTFGEACSPSVAAVVDAVAALVVLEIAGRAPTERARVGEHSEPQGAGSRTQRR